MEEKSQFPRPLEAFLIIIASFFLIVLITQSLLFILVSDPEQINQNSLALKMLITFGEVGLIIVPLVYVKSRGLSYREVFRWNPIPAFLIPWGFAIGLGISVIGDELGGGAAQHFELGESPVEISLVEAGLGHLEARLLPHHVVLQAFLYLRKKDERLVESLAVHQNVAQVQPQVALYVLRKRQLQALFQDGYRLVGPVVAKGEEVCIGDLQLHGFGRIAIGFHQGFICFSGFRQALFGAQPQIDIDAVEPGI